MNNNFDITATIVLFNNDKEILFETINSFLNTSLNVKLYLVDNYHLPLFDDYDFDNRIEYIFLNSNRGFGSAHNSILKQPNKIGKYHLILNPDILFDKGVLECLYKYMNENIDIGNIIPKTYYPDGDICPVCRLLPTPIDWIIRMFLPFGKIKEKIDYYFLLKFADQNSVINAPYLSGCFMFIRKEVILEIGIFDEKIFMYGEDTDLNRRIHTKYKTIFYPFVSIIHHGSEASHTDFKMFMIHAKAAVYYLNKWGWFFDKERKRINKQMLLKYR